MKKTYPAVRFILTAAFLSVMLVPAAKLSLLFVAEYLLIFTLLSAFAIWYKKKKGSVRHGNIFYDFVFTVILVQDFSIRWMSSGKIAKLADILHLSVDAFILAGAILLGCLSIYALYTTRCMIQTLVVEKCETMSCGQYVVFGLRIIFLLFLQYLSVEYSFSDSLSSILQKSLPALLTNIILLLLINLFALLVFQKSRFSFTTTSVIFSLWSIANYYTIQFHGSPLYLSEFANAGTAAAVAFQYHYRITGQVCCILLLFLVELVFLARHSLNFPVSRNRVIFRLIVLAAFVAVFFPLYRYTISKNRPWMPWEVSMKQSGFLVCTIEDAVQRADPVVKPDGYDKSSLPDYYPAVIENFEQYPDIIFILNETFCDLSTYIDLSPEQNYLNDFYQIEGASYCRVVTPNVGGGTNNSEFELLTGKSMYLLKAMAPFTYLNEQILGRSAVTCMKNLGYSTAAMHCEQAKNYSRDQAFPALGFDIVKLGPESFDNCDSYGNRKWLDSGNYLDMLSCYEQMPDMPRFVYLLTFQNHGGYEQNEETLDTVHLRQTYGDLTDDLNEFLTSVKLSGMAFRDLTQTLSNLDRQVIVCMVGDHAPSFINSLAPNDSLTSDELEIAKRTVPCVIWSNFQTELPSDGECYSMTDLAPLIMSLANLPLPQFYQYILTLHEALPVRTSTGLYQDREGRTGYYEQDDFYYPLMNLYYCMEYNSLLEGEEYREDLFEFR